jgi:AAA family ATP:ADP antiporter
MTLWRRLRDWVARIEAHERRAVILASLCHFVLLASYYVLRPIRDTVATMFGSSQLQTLFTATFIGSLIVSPLYAAAASRIKLKQLLPGVFWFWLCNILLFELLFSLSPQNKWIAGSYYVWLSVVNLFIVSVFWSLMVDLFTASQATRLFAFISFGGEVGAITGPAVTRTLIRRLGFSGLLLLAAAGFVIMIVIIYLLIREKERLRQHSQEIQTTSMDQRLSGNPFDGFSLLFKSPYLTSQAAFALLMSWANTIAYFFQTDLIARAFSGLERRGQVVADIDLVVNICTALILLLGIGPVIQRFGVTAGLVLNPLMMVPAFIAVLLSPSVFTIQMIQIVRRVAQYAIARPSREICFTVLDQNSRYRAKNVIDTVVYRFGDVTSAWMQAGFRWVGFGLGGAVGLGLGVSVLWGGIALLTGRRYESIRAQQLERAA